jgi:intracellular septation protein
MTRRSAAICSSVNQYTRLLIEAGPLAVFFVTNSQAGIMAGTGAFMVATAVAVLLSWHFERKLPIMPLVGCFFVLFFGGLTLWLEDDLFIKLKPTVVNLLFATVLFTSLALRRNVMKRLLGTVLSLTETGWRILTVRWACFFVVLAVLNEIVWRTMPTDAWVNFKVFGFLPLTMIFAAAQFPLLQKYAVQDSGENK